MGIMFRNGKFYGGTVESDNSSEVGQIDTTEGVTYHGEIFNNYESNKATGMYSHAEGSGTTASGTRSHAEGSRTEASGMGSHVEGMNGTASGQASHAEGYYTKASSMFQHVQGKYNIED